MVYLNNVVGGQFLARPYAADLAERDATINRGGQGAQTDHPGIRRTGSDS